MQDESNIWTRRVLITILLMPLLMALTPALQAQAETVPTAAVLEIQVRAPSHSSTTLSQAATEAVAAAMSRKNLYSVKDRKDTEQAVKELDLHLPMSSNAAVKLGQNLGVDRVVNGEITEVSFTDKPRRAHVKLSISLMHVIIGEIVYNTSVVGSSLPAATGTDAMLIEQAIKRAAESAFYSSCEMPTAVITTMEENSTTINRGSRDGIRVGDKAIVIRGNERVNFIRVFSVSASESQVQFPEGRRSRVRLGNQVIFVSRSAKVEQGQ
ncbi:MAG: hypothetical protein V4671_14720 [Armatimonadota bacterium]